MKPTQPDRQGHFGPYGGMFVPETLMEPLNELTRVYKEALKDPSFKKELDYYLREYVGRPTPLYFAERMTRELGGPKIYLKREDLCHTGAHKINNSLGQILLAKRMGKTRIIAETGLFFIAPYLYPCVLIYSIFGGRAIGPQSLMIMFMLTCAFLIDPRETLMPYVVNGIKLVDDCKGKTGRTAILCVLAIILGLCVATPLTLYFQYDRGVNWNDGWASKMVPKFSAEEIVRVRQRLMAQDVLEESEAVSGWARFAAPTPDRRSMIAFLAGLGGVLVFALGRLRFARWPLHPVVFLAWGDWAGYQTAWPFLIGCGLKLATTKYGGIAAYQRIKPLMFGLIAGDMLSGLGITIFGLIYHIVTGELPTPYRVLLS